MLNPLRQSPNSVTQGIVLDILYMMKTKLNHCINRALPKNLENLQFLLANYADEIRETADQLDEEDQEYFFGLEEVRMLDRRSRGRCLVWMWRRALLLGDG